jgi:hypothetical protein
MLLLRGLVLADRLLELPALFASEGKHYPPETGIEYCYIEAIAVWMPLDEPSTRVRNMQWLS